MKKQIGWAIIPLAANFRSWFMPAQGSYLVQFGGGNRRNKSRWKMEADPGGPFLGVFGCLKRPAQPTTHRGTFVAQCNCRCDDVILVGAVVGNGRDVLIEEGRVFLYRSSFTRVHQREAEIGLAWIGVTVEGLG